MERDARIEMRCREEEKQEMEEAARREGQPLSTWLRGLALREARRVVERKGKGRRS